MARRRRRIRLDRTGGPYIRPSGLPLPRTHESVRRFVHMPQRRVLNSTLRQMQRLFGISPAKRVFRKARSFAALGALAIRDPRKALFCVRRKIRREVMFALGVGGRRGSAPGPYRRTQDSQYRC